MRWPRPSKRSSMPWWTSPSRSSRSPTPDLAAAGRPCPARARPARTRCSTYSRLRGLEHDRLDARAVQQVARAPARPGRRRRSRPASARFMSAFLTLSAIAAPAWWRYGGPGIVPDACAASPRCSPARLAADRRARPSRATTARAWSARPTTASSRSSASAWWWRSPCWSRCSRPAAGAGPAQGRAQGDRAAQARRLVGPTGRGPRKGRSPVGTGLRARGGICTDHAAAPRSGLGVNSLRNLAPLTKLPRRHARRRHLRAPRRRRGPHDRPPGAPQRGRRARPPRC